MKSRTSCFNKTIFKKNLTRFAPAWGLFTVWIGLSVFVSCTFNFPQAGSTLLELGQSYCLYAFLYAPLCAQLLFGDLFNSRMCNALHALPLRRETWFDTHMISGLVFHLIPVVCTTALAGLLLGLGGYEGNMAVVPLFLVTTTLQYIFFFGLAVFSIFCVGSRFAHAAVYVLLNTGSLILQWLISSLYTPLFYGVETNPRPFQFFSPISYMAENSFLEVEQISVTDDQWNQIMVDSRNILPGDGFAYYFFATAAGVLLILGALWLYRKRKLECAGDFLAIRALGPVFSLIFTFTVGVFFHSISFSVLLLLGLAVGWFSSQMLLERTVQVFHKKTFRRFGVLLGVFLITMAVTALDPLGIEKWIPEEEEVESVSLYEGHYSIDFRDPVLILEDAEDVGTVIGIHRDCLDYYYENTDDFTRIAMVDLSINTNDKNSIPLILSYRLKNGRTVNRYYYVGGEENLQQLVLWLNTPEMVFGKALTEAEFLEQTVYVEWHKVNSLEKGTVFSQADLQELFRAILADCEAGTMSQELENYVCMNLKRSYTLTFSNGLRIQVYEESYNTLQWILKHR